MPTQPSTCGICARTAISYHYGSVSCNACKMFFRRAIVESRKYVCLKQGKCLDRTSEINEKRPTKCRACRWKKCIEMGMQPQLIILQEKPQTSTDMQMITTIEKLKALEVTRKKVYLSINIDENLSFCDIVAQPSCLTKLSTPQSIDWTKTALGCKPWGSLLIRVLAEISKHFDIYDRILLSDRVILLKSSIFKISSLVHAYDSFKQNFDVAVTPENESCFPDYIKNHPKCKKLVSVLTSRMFPPIIECQLTENEYLLLIMILFCDPNVPMLSPSGRELISIEQQKYSNMLLRHCLLTDFKSGASRFGKLLAIGTITVMQVETCGKLLHQLEMMKQGTVTKLMENSVESVNPSLPA